MIPAIIRPYEKVLQTVYSVDILRFCNQTCSSSYVPIKIRKPLWQCSISSVGKDMMIKPINLKALCDISRIYQNLGTRIYNWEIKWKGSSTMWHTIFIVSQDFFSFFFFTLLFLPASQTWYTFFSFFFGHEKLYSTPTPTLH